MIEDINFGKEIGFGVFIGVLFIILNAYLGLVIGIPLLAFSSETERYVITSGIAPLVEELVFRAVLPFVIISALVFVGIEGFIALALAFIVNVIVFPLFHYVAYGSSITAASSLFIGAGLFAAIAFIVTYYDSDAEDFQVPIASIIAHAIINTWLAVKISGLVIVGG